MLFVHFFKNKKDSLHFILIPFDFIHFYFFFQASTNRPNQSILIFLGAGYPGTSFPGYELSGYELSRVRVIPGTSYPGTSYPGTSYPGTSYPYPLCSNQKVDTFPARQKTSLDSKDINYSYFQIFITGG